MGYAFLLTAVGLTTVDALLFAPFGALVVAVPLGVLAGSVLGLFTNLSRSAPRVAFALVGLLAGLVFAFALDAPLKLGVYTADALRALIGAPIAGCLGGLLFELLWRQRVRLLAVIAAGTVIAFPVFARESIHFTAYPPFNDGLTFAAFAIGGIGVSTFLRKGPSSRVLGVAFVVSMAIVAFLPASLFIQINHQGSNAAVLRVLRSLADFDRDGSASLFGGGDCAGFDGDIGPHALDVPGDGIDSNCWGGDAREVSDETPSFGTASGASVLLVTIDTIRFASTSLGRDDRDTTPRLRQLAERGLAFRHAYAASSYTDIAMATIHWGIGARSMRWRDTAWTGDGRAVAPDGDEDWWNRSLTLDDPRAPLAEQVSAAGVSTAAAVIDHPALSVFRESGPYHRGFDRYADLPPDSTDVDVVDAALEHLGDAQAPFFHWVHLYDAHLPDTEHDGAAHFGESRHDRYDHELHATDRQLGRLLDAVADRDDLYVLVTADHGERFGPFMRAHGFELNEDLLHVPMVLTGPGITPAQPNRLVAHIDIAPTIRAILTSEGYAELDLRRDVAVERVVFADVWKVDARGRAVVDLCAAISDDRFARFDLLHGVLEGAEALRPALEDYLNAPRVQIPR